MNKIYNNGSLSKSFDVPPKPIYFESSYFGSPMNLMQRKLKHLFKTFFPHLKLIFISRSQCTIGSYFRFKDKLPISFASSVIYKYSCSHCPATYIGETRKQFEVRICQHKGLSFRTGKPLSEINSKIYDHFFEHSHQINSDNFSILSHSKQHETKILESIFLHSERPTLNDRNSSYQLCILN